MNVGGYGISDRQIADATGMIADLGRSFTSGEVEEALVKAGVDAKAAYRGADRLMQRLRRKGILAFDKSRRCWSFI